MSRILIVDDNVNLNVFVEGALANDGFNVASVADAEHACEFLEQNPVDVVVSDLHMPEMSGMDLLKHIRKEHPDVVVLLLSLFADGDTAREALDLGAFDCLSKPTSVEMLCTTVQRAVAYKQAVEGTLDLDTIVGPYDLYHSVVAASPHMQNVCKTVDNVAELEGPVLLLGEKGCGKALLAHNIHEHGRRRHEEMVVLDCKEASAAAYEELGFIFDGSDDLRAAVKKHFPTTRITPAGTVVLESVECLSPEIEGRLLFAIQQQKSGTLHHKTEQPYPRIIATTTASCDELTTGSIMNKALYEDLAQLAITIKPLRERREDILPLMHHILKEQEHDGDIEVVPTLNLDVAYALEQYDWPGNCGELKDILLYAVSRTPDHRIKREHLPEAQFRDIIIPHHSFAERVKTDFLVGDSARALIAS